MQVRTCLSIALSLLAVLGVPAALGQESQIEARIKHNVNGRFWSLQRCGESLRRATPLRNTA